MFSKSTNLPLKSESLLAKKKNRSIKLVAVFLFTLLLCIGNNYTYAQADDSAVVDYKNDTSHLFTVTKSGKVRFGRYKNSMLLDSVLSTDAQGNLIMVPNSARFNWDQRYTGPREVNFRHASSAAFGKIAWQSNNLRFHAGDSNAQVGSGSSVNLYSNNSFAIYSSNFVQTSGVVGSPTQLQLIASDWTQGKENSILLKSDKIEFPNLRNNLMGDSVLTTDANGVVKLKALPQAPLQLAMWSMDNNMNIYNANWANVGVGTQAPTAKFHTRGTVRHESYKNNIEMDSVLTTDTAGNLILVAKTAGFEWNNLFTGPHWVEFDNTENSYKSNIGYNGVDFSLNSYDSQGSGAANLKLNPGGFNLAYNGEESNVNIMGMKIPGNSVLSLNVSNDGVKNSTIALTVDSIVADVRGAFQGNGYPKSGFRVKPEGIQFPYLKNNTACDSVLTTDASGFLKFKYVTTPTPQAQEDSSWAWVDSNIYNKNRGYVGIGTQTPTAKFHTKGSIRFENFKNNLQGDSVLTTDENGNLRFVYMPYGSSGGGGGASYSFLNGVTQSNGNVALGGQLQDSVKINLSGNQLSFNNGADKVMHMSSDGNVGIGARADANYKLNVYGDMILGHHFDNIGGNEKLSFGGTSNTDALFLQRYNTAANATDLRVNIGDDGGSTDRFTVGYTSYETNNWVHAMVVEAGGKVGIATDQITGQLAVGRDHGTKLAVGNGQWAQSAIIRTAYDNNNGDYTDLLVPGAAANTSLIRMNQAGNVGIGTLVPDAQYKLSVNGRIRAKGLRVQSAGWSDFVFEPGYKLRSLPEVEKFIKANKHLPEIPSTKEVMKDGQEVGEIQSKLLQKIEELTLYTIDLNKQVKALEDKNKKLEAQQQQIGTLQQQLDELKKLIINK